MKLRLVHRASRTPRSLAAALAAAAAVLSLVVATAAPAAAEPPFHESFVTNDDSVLAGGSTTSDDGCRSTDWFIQASTNFDEVLEIIYLASIFNSCVGALEVVTGFTDQGVLEITGLHSARIVATIPLTDQGTGLPAGEVVVDNIFTAFGPADTGHSRLFDHSEHSMLQVVSNGRWRQATSTGPLTVDFAQITTGGSHTLFIFRDPA